MENKTVFVILGEHYPVELARQEIKEEGYPYKFIFNGTISELIHADEVWVFGNTVGEENYYHNMAKTLDKSIWVMG